MQRQTLDTYVSILREVKARMEVVNRLGQESQSYIPMKPAEELCNLQLRYIAELIAVGCIVVHQDELDYPNRLRKAYKPADIFAVLERLNPDFYPIAVEPEDKINSEGSRILARRRDDWADMRQIRQIWSSVGDKLHRGSYSRIFANDHLDFELIHEYKCQITRLLDKHYYLTKDRSYMVVFQMSVNGYVGWALFTPEGVSAAPSWAAAPS